MQARRNCHCDQCPYCERWNLKAVVTEFLELLDGTEESDSGKVFHPVQISSCRVEKTPKVRAVIERMRGLTSE